MSPGIYLIIEKIPISKRKLVNETLSVPAWEWSTGDQTMIDIPFVSLPEACPAVPNYSMMPGHPHGFHSLFENNAPLFFCGRPKRSNPKTKQRQTNF